MRNQLLWFGCVAVLAACGGSNVAQLKAGPESAFARGDNFAAVSKALVAEAAASKTGGLQSEDSFYIAIHKSSLQKRWFMSAFLSQVHPASEYNIPFVSLDTKVVSCKVQNGKLYVFDVDETKAWSNELDPEVIVDAYPIIDSAKFKDLAGAANYILVDPAGGLNRFSAFSDSVANSYDPAKFQVELVYSKNYKTLSDGISFDQDFTGYSDKPDLFGERFGPENPYRASGTVSISLREYKESPGFVPAPMVGVAGGGQMYFGSKWALVQNQGNYTQNAIKWATSPSAAPKPWVISRNILDIAQSEELKDYDVVGALKLGIESWNDAFGYKALEASIADESDSIGSESKSFLLVDTNPSAGYAFANWRDNPNTGEIRAASIYFSSVWFKAAVQVAEMLTEEAKPDAPSNVPSVKELASNRDALKNLLAMRTAPKSPARALSWDGLPRQESCQLRADESIDRLKISAFVRKLRGQRLNAASLTKKEIVERYLTHVVAHEVGHTLGLRHNFKGSLGGAPASSVMDYLDDVDSVISFLPQSYDHAAIRFHYGLTQELAKPVFCNDSYVRRDAECMYFDFGMNPWLEAVKPIYESIVYDFNIFAFIFGLDAETHAFARGAPTEEMREDAFSTLMIPVLPIDPALLAKDPLYGMWFDILSHFALMSSFLATPEEVSAWGIRINRPLSPDKAVFAISHCSDIIRNSDKIRSFGTRSTCVDILAKLHSDDALVAMQGARADLQKPENMPPSTASAAERALFEALQKKVDHELATWLQ